MNESLGSMCKSPDIVERYTKSNPVLNWIFDQFRTNETGDTLGDSLKAIGYYLCTIHEL